MCETWLEGFSKVSSIQLSSIGYYVAHGIVLFPGYSNSHISGPISSIPYLGLVSRCHFMGKSRLKVERAQVVVLWCIFNSSWHCFAYVCMVQTRRRYVFKKLFPVFSIFFSNPSPTQRAKKELFFQIRLCFRVFSCTQDDVLMENEIHTMFEVFFFCFSLSLSLCAHCMHFHHCFCSIDTGRKQKQVFESTCW